MMLNLLLAQTPAQPVPTQPTQPQGPGYMFIWILFAIVIFWFILFRPKQKERREKQQLLSSIKKYDKVLTIGGIIGTVMEVRDDEVIIKVDDNSNTRMKFIRGAIQKVISSAESEK